MKRVVVIFQATQQETESLALAFGLGAVQGGADIRLRHLDPSPATSLAHAGYGTLRVADLAWAQGLAIFVESQDPARLGELRSALQALAEGPDRGARMVYLFHRDQTAESFQLLDALASRCGFQRMADIAGLATPGHMNEMGRKMAETEVASSETAAISKQLK